MTSTPSAVLFDLDGTLVDTAYNFVTAINDLRYMRKEPPLSIDRIRPAASHGINALLKAGIDMDTDHPEFQYWRQQLLACYQTRLAQADPLFDGITEMIHMLSQRNIEWGIVTNKAAHLAQLVVQAMDWPKKPSTLVGGDTTPYPKPHPEPLLHAAMQMAIDPCNIWYVGDAQRDIQAGKSAGMPSWVAMWGYLGADDQPNSWGADGLLNQPYDLFKHMEKQS